MVLCMSPAGDTAWERGRARVFIGGVLARAGKVKQEPTLYREGPPYQRRGSLQLWQFLVTLLDDPANAHFIAWTGRGMEFKLIEPEEVRELLPWSWECLWGCRSGLDPSYETEPSHSHLRRDTCLYSPARCRNLPLTSPLPLGVACAGS